MFALVYCCVCVCVYCCVCVCLLCVCVYCVFVLLLLLLLLLCVCIHVHVFLYAHSPSCLMHVWKKEETHTYYAHRHVHGEMIKGRRLLRRNSYTDELNSLMKIPSNYVLVFSAGQYIFVISTSECMEAMAC